MPSRNWLFGIGWIVLICVLICSDKLAADENQSTTDGTSRRQQFDRRIAPLLARRCLDCHSGDEPKGKLDLSTSASTLRGGESGKGIVPGDTAASLLWQRVSDDEMPPEKPLSADEKKILNNWIASGARWGSDPIDPFRFTTDSRAGYDWWSLQPVIRPAIGESADSSWPRNPIDHFVLAKLTQNRLTPSAEADKRTLIRRLSFDLLGLPPAPEEIARFEQESSPAAYENLVERILASPHYGERWARHWLDVIRFGESQGFERDKLRSNSWRYRDWVVDAFNQDLPYDEFSRRQLAGDVLAPHASAGRIATGFLVAGPYDEVGNSQISSAMRAVVRQDELEDIVSSVGQTFLGLTINCARCHDHKFDPVKQSEYYQLTAALAGVRHGQPKLTGAAIQSKIADQSLGIAVQIEFLHEQIAAIEAPIRRRILAERTTGETPVVSLPEPMAEWNFDANLEDQFGKLHGELKNGAELRDGRLILNGQGAHVATAPLTGDVTEKTLEVSVILDNLDQQGGGVLSIQTLDGQVFDSIVFAERKTRRWMAGSNFFKRTQSFQGAEESEADRRLIHLAIVYHADGTIAGYRNGRPYGKPYKSSAPVTFKSGEAQILFGLRHAKPSGNRLLAGAIDRARLYDKALSPDQVAASAGVASDFVSESELLPWLTTKDREQRAQLKLEIDHLRRLLQRVQETTIYANQPKQPAATHFLLRGNPTQKREILAAGGVAALVGVQADFHLAADAPEARRRVELAHWITHSDNPLFARVIVNRLWHYHFGSGLVDSPNDFGFNGGRPSHPELIDWLAAELRQNNWSLKALQRQIVTSATYRQSSRTRPDAVQLDAENRLLWRKNPLRLEAEVVRDALLVAAKRMNPEIGGPGYEDFRTFTQNTQFYLPVDPIGNSFNRRSLYRTWVRSGRNRFLDVFDCPDPSTKTPKRAVTTTPLQALALMNNSFVLRMADRFAERIVAEVGNNPREQIRHTYQLAYNRDAGADEIALGIDFVKQHGLTAYCRVIFNSNEFLYVD